jgi:hypothetical protein
MKALEHYKLHHDSIDVVVVAWQFVEALADLHHWE